MVKQFAFDLASLIISGVFSTQIKPSSHVKRIQANALSKVMGFVRAFRFPPTGKFDRSAECRLGNTDPQ